VSVCDVGVLWPNSWMDQDETRHAGRPWPWPHCVRWGHSSPPPKKRGHCTQFSAHVSCGQTVGWIKMPLGIEVGLSPHHIELDGDPATPSSTIFGPCLLWPNGWMDQDATWCHGGRLQPRPHCATWGPSCPPPRKRGTAPPNFQPMSIVAKWLDG